MSEQVRSNLPTLGDVMRMSSAHLAAARDGDDTAVIASALLWIIEHMEGSGYCYELRQRLERVALRYSDVTGENRKDA